ncbi:unnamed protein product [Symbiodinium pilosum]|uniref:Uncharacterized protein n=1 Tax=Symbiodinium pilosum TaxID=2952 RepID=A0A812P0T6_SYMPI|nr:unnamed protein product [Symbiodinium pilosum]
MPGLYRPRVKDLAWAVTVGGSVTLRLVCAVQLSTFHASVRGTTLAASCWVSALSSLLSFLCLFSFLPRSVNLRNEEISELATITGALALPAFLVIAAVDLLGLSFAQLILLLVAVLSAVLTADSGKVRAQGWKFLVLAVGAGLLGIAGGWGPSMDEDLSKYCGPLVALLVAGASAVVQGRFLVADRAVPYKTESSYELMCLFVAAAAHVPFVLVFLLSGDSFRMPRLADAHQWAFMAMQGVFYVRSLRPLTATLGTAFTFSLVLLGQLLATLMMDTLIQDGILPRLLCLSMVLFGLFMSQATETLNEPALHAMRDTLNIVELSPVGNANDANQKV